MFISYTPSTHSFFISGHVTTQSRKLPFKSANSPFAKQWHIADRKHLLPNTLRRFLLAEWYFVTNSAHKSVPLLYHFLVLTTVLGTMRRAVDSTGHRVPRTKPTCLLHTWRPHRQPPFALVLHLHQHQSSHNLHPQYLAKNQSTQHCQSLITPGSNHPLMLKPHKILNLPLDECIDNTHI
jgi:hypothetical protein